MKSRSHIMVVDDEEVMLTLLDRILKHEGYEVTTASDGNSALVLMKKRRPDLVILDIMMPGLDGFQVLDLIRRRYDVPVIMLTARHEVTNLHDALALGADDYVRKPFSRLELMARIKAKLRRARPEITVDYEAV